MELFKPILAVGQKEMEHFVLSVIETEAVPCRMLVSVAWVEKLVWVTGKVAETFNLVLYGVAMDDIHYYSNAVLVGCVYETFELFRCSEAA